MTDLLPAPRQKCRNVKSRPTRSFNGVTHPGRPAYGMHQGAPHVTPKVCDGVVGSIALVRVRQLQATANYRHDIGHTGPTHVLGVHDLDAGANFDAGLQAFGQLGRGADKLMLEEVKEFAISSKRTRRSDSPPLYRSQLAECWPPPALTSDMLSSLGCSASHLCDQIRSMLRHIHFTFDSRFSLYYISHSWP